MSDAPRVVFDCNTFLQTRSVPEGPAGSCVQLALDGKASLFISPTVLEELRDVTSRPKVIAKLQLVSNRVEESFEAIELAATLLEGFPEPFTYECDPDDAHYVNLAVAANAKLIVSRDKDLLDLMDSSKSGGMDFTTRFLGLKILSPVAFLKEFASAHGPI